MPAARVSPANTNYNGRRNVLRNSNDSSGSECPSLQDASEEEKEKDSLTPYQKVHKKLQSDEKWHQDISLGKRIGFYRIREELGTGNFSQVKAGTHALTKARVAVKILDKSKLDSKTQKMLAREIASMESLHHPHVIRLYEVLETLSKIYLVMEHAGGGELFHRISQSGSFSEKEARPLFAQITAAVDHMHNHHIVHRDLKAENVFFSGPNTVKVGDFGFSTRVRDIHEPLRTFCGSPPYAAPELFRDDSYVGPLVDVWALGVLLYFMLTGTMPFKATTVAGLKKQILEGEFTIPEYVSTECRFLIVGVLKQDPLARTNLNQIKRSTWLEGQPLPTALPREEWHGVVEDANGNGLALPSVEKEVRQNLKELGITESMVDDAQRKGSRSSVMGAYRIVLHRTMMEARPNVESQVNDLETPKFLKTKGNPKRWKLQKNKKSKTCTIL